MIKSNDTAGNHTVISRRGFVKTGIAGIAGMALGLQAVGIGRNTDPVKIGIIGMGSRGGGIAHVLHTLSGLELTACCDIMEQQLQVSASAPASVKRHRDYRDLLDDRSVDAVVITLPEHLHFPATVA